MQGRNTNGQIINANKLEVIVFLNIPSDEGES